MSIRLLVGLGNPGPEYHSTRHNAGFWLAETYARAQGVALHYDRGLSGMLGKTAKTWLLLPQTYMNRSGQAVAACARFHKILPQEILVAHDELDLPAGVAKLKKGGGHAGHNGLKDISTLLGSSDFLRLRIGIGHPRDSNTKQAVADFVLHAPSQAERVKIDNAIARSIELLPQIFAGDIQTAMILKT